MGKGKSIPFEISDVIKDYQSGMGVNPICEKYHIGKVKVRKIIADAGLEMKKRGGQDKGGETDSIDNVRLSDDARYPNIQGKHYVAVLRTDKSVVLADYQNKAGNLTKYIKEQFGNESTLWERKKYFVSTGMQWWEQWFNIELVDDAPVKKCPYCDWTTVDTTNASGMFETHLKKKHNISKMQYIESHPEDKGYFSLKNLTLNRQMETNKYNFVECKICGLRFARLGHHLGIKHKMTIEEYQQRFSDAVITSELFHSEQSVRSSIQNENMTCSFESKPEREIKEFITSKGFECVTDRHILHGKEIDMYIPELKIGFEYDGLLFHSANGGQKPFSYHLNKTIEAEKQGVRLIHIFEDEYIHHKDIVLAKISHILHADVDKPRVMARKCTIKQIDRTLSNDFLDEYHIQSRSKSASIFYGAFFNDELIAVMGFYREYNRTIKSYQWVLDRFASDYHYRCQGLGSRMFSKFVQANNPQRIVSLADRRWSSSISSNIYTQMGFRIEEINAPSYSYILKRNISRMDKKMFRKNVLIKKYPELHFDNTIPEQEMALKAGFDWIWDCGKIRYVWTRPDNQ